MKDFSSMGQYWDILPNSHNYYVLIGRWHLNRPKLVYCRRALLTLHELAVTWDCLCQQTHRQQVVSRSQTTLQAIGSDHKRSPTLQAIGSDHTQNTRLLLHRDKLLVTLPHLERHPVFLWAVLYSSCPQHMQRLWLLLRCKLGFGFASQYGLYSGLYSGLYVRLYRKSCVTYVWDHLFTALQLLPVRTLAQTLTEAIPPACRKLSGTPTSVCRSVMVSRMQDRGSLPVKLEIIDVEKRKGLSKYYVSPWVEFSSCINRKNICCYILACNIYLHAHTDVWI